MNRQVIFFLLFIFAQLCISQAYAQDTIVATENKNPQDSINVFKKITTDSTGNATLRIHQDKRIEQLFIDRVLFKNAGSLKGFRVQVFSSNRQQSAKDDAFRIEKLVRDKFPDKGVYLTYQSPSWKVRVGDFRSREEALEFREELMEALPSMRREMIVVGDNITFAGSK